MEPRLSSAHVAAFLLSLVAAATSFADPPAITAIASSRSLTEADRESVDRYASFWMGAFRRAADKPDEVEDARRRLLVPLEGIGVTGTFRDQYTRSLVPEVEGVLDEANGHGAVNAIIVLSRLGTDKALDFLVRRADVRYEDRVYIRLTAARGCGQLLGEYSTELRSTAMGRAVRSIRDAATNEPVPAVARHQIEAVLAADDARLSAKNRSDIHAAAIGSLCAVAESASEVDHDLAAAKLKEIYPIVARLRQVFLELNADASGQKVFGEKLGPCLERILTVATAHWEQAQRADKASYAEYIELCESVLPLIDSVVAAGGQAPPSTDLKGAWVADEPERYQADLDKWKTRISGYGG